MAMLADAMPHLVWMAADDGRVVYYNQRAREYAGIEALPDGTWRWQAVVHPDDLAHTVTAWTTAARTRTAYACEHRVQMADETFRWHVSRAVPVVANDGTVTWYGTATDIDEQKRAQEELRAVNASRDLVVAAVAHDLRNPLAVVSTSLPVLSVAIAGDDRARQALRRIERQVSHMQKLIDDLVDAAALRAAKPLALEIASTDLTALVRDLADEFTTVQPTRELRLRTPAEALVGQWDAKRLGRVIENLLSNAAKYSDSGSIDLDLERRDDSALLSVSDRGLGVPEGEREQIFGWFARGSNVPSSTLGTGVGLAGARAIVEQHGGTLTLESAVGRGSTFRVTLPLTR